MPYEVLFVDWDGTLSNSRFWERWNNDVSHQTNYELLQSALFASSESEALLVEWMTGLKSYEDVLGIISRATGIAYSALEEELRHSAEHMEFIDTEAPELIRQLRATGVRVYIATDNMDTFRHWTVPELGLTNLFDGILASDEIGALKSDIASDGKNMFFESHFIKHPSHRGRAALIDNSLNNKVVEQCEIDFLHVNESQSATDHMKKILADTIPRLTCP